MLLYERLKAVYAGLILTQCRLNREILGELIAAAESQHWKDDDGISDGDAFDGCATLVFTAPDGQAVTVRPDCESTAPADVARRLHEASPGNFPAHWRAPA
jgi:hypothetical protein